MQDHEATELAAKFIENPYVSTVRGMVAAGLTKPDFKVVHQELSAFFGKAEEVERQRIRLLFREFLRLMHKIDLEK